MIHEILLYDSCKLFYVREIHLIFLYYTPKRFSRMIHQKDSSLHDWQIRLSCEIHRKSYKRIPPKWLSSRFLERNLKNRNEENVQNEKWLSSIHWKEFNESYRNIPQSLSRLVKQSAFYQLVMLKARSHCLKRTYLWVIKKESFGHLRDLC